jgi:hypothetical protein
MNKISVTNQCKARFEYTNSPFISVTVKSGVGGAWLCEISMVQLNFLFVKLLLKRFEVFLNWFYVK